MFDPEKFGAAMGEAIQKAVAPLQKEIADLKKQLAEKPDFKGDIAAEVQRAVAALPAPKDGKDCDMETVKGLIEEAVKAIPAPKDGKDGANGKDGLDGAAGEPGAKGADGVNGKDGRDGVDGAAGKDGLNGERGQPGEKGADGLGLAGAMIDRDGALQITLTNGEVKSLGPVVGKDGSHGKDGAAGVSLDSFELEYLPETHEIAVKAACGARAKEIRYPAGGIRPGGYWREGTKAKAGEAWVHDGSTFYAVKDTEGKPESKSGDWIIGARKGRDGETTIKTINAHPGPIKLHGNPFPQPDPDGKN